MKVETEKFKTDKFDPIVKENMKILRNSPIGDALSLEKEVARRLVCRKGTRLIQGIQPVCEYCNKGSYRQAFQEPMTECQHCPFNFYNDHLGQSECKKCPSPNNYTLKKGAVSLEECVKYKFIDFNKEKKDGIFLIKDDDYIKPFNLGLVILGILIEKDNIMNILEKNTNYVNISELQNGMTGVTIVGIVIGRNGPRSFPSKRDHTVNKNVLLLTVRDSAHDFINVTCWGSLDYINNLSYEFIVGSCVEISNPTIQVKPLNGSSDYYSPTTPSHFILHAGEHKATVKMYLGADRESYLELQRIPTKSPYDFYSFESIIEAGKQETGSICNILGVVRQVLKPRKFINKKGMKSKLCEIKLFDQSCDSFSLILWNDSFISMAEDWRPKQQILFATDVRLKYDLYRKRMTADTTSKTIITINPRTNQALNLYKYSTTVTFDSDDKISAESINLAQITEMYNISEIIQLQSIPPGEAGLLGYCGITYAYITFFPLDCSVEKLYGYKCQFCGVRVAKSASSCSNLSCATKHATKGFVKYFNIPMEITDECGTLKMCRFEGKTVEALLNHSVDEFITLSEEYRNKVKWQFMTERFKIFFKTSFADQETNPNPTVFQRSAEEEYINKNDDDEYDERDVFHMIRDIKDPEHPYSLEELNVLEKSLIEVNNENNKVIVQFTPTIPHCSLATLIGLSIRVKLLRDLPKRFKVDVVITPGTHASELAINKQLADKERVAAALENVHLLTVVNQCINGEN
ncbi:DgyrCDS10850 [Dimorphilus gyrociliatus]|uniref:DgyrCDS10850 n=1 Tax=Dimorphilus gyrociliatus TaxID=2664684 RepID=A0A7I8W2L3_9ANNE|nr:DgyrCDS10850 [Dimorphilus gyrociliatus]